MFLGPLAIGRSDFKKPFSKQVLQYLLRLCTNSYKVIALCVCVCVCVLSHLSRVGLSVIQWTEAHQAPLSMGFFMARVLEWVAMPSSTGSS